MNVFDLLAISYHSDSLSGNFLERMKRASIVSQTNSFSDPVTSDSISFLCDSTANGSLKKLRIRDLSLHAPVELDCPSINSSRVLGFEILAYYYLELLIALFKITSSFT
jgi:hypothetical protein